MKLDYAYRKPHLLNQRAYNRSSLKQRGIRINPITYFAAVIVLWSAFVWWWMR